MAPPITLDHTLASLYTTHGLPPSTPLIFDHHFTYTHLPLTPHHPPETVFPEDEDPTSYGTTPQQVAYFRNLALKFKIQDVFPMIGGEVFVHLPHVNPRDLERSQAAFDQARLPKIHFVDLEGSKEEVGEKMREIMKGKKLAFTRPKGWHRGFDCVVAPEMAYEVNSKRFLLHPGIPTPLLETAGIDDGVLRSRGVPFVVKLMRSSSNNGVFMVRDEEERLKMLEQIERFKQRGGTEVQLSEFVESEEETYCLVFFMGKKEGGKERKVTFLAVNFQVMSVDGHWAGGQIDYSKQGEYEVRFRETMMKVAGAMPDEFMGMVGCDVLVDGEGRQLVVDLNPRIVGGIGSVFLSKHFLSKGFNWGEFTMFGFKGPNERVYDVLSEKVETGQLVIYLAVDILDGQCMVAVAMGGKDRADLAIMREWVKGKLAEEGKVAQVTETETECHEISARMNEKLTIYDVEEAAIAVEG